MSQLPLVEALYYSPCIPDITDIPDIDKALSIQGKTGTELNEQIIFTQPFPLMRVNNLLMSATTSIGNRPEQQDRLLVAPSLCNNDLSLFAIFDGTTGAHAAEFVKEHFLSTLYDNVLFQKLSSLSHDEKTDRKIVQNLLTQIIVQTYTTLDASLLKYCEMHQHHQLDYTATTSVTVFLYRPTQQLYIAHLADSQAIVGVPERRDLKAYNDLTFEKIMASRRDSCPLDSYLLTKPHKPDDPYELDRIRRAGGSLVYLHGRKPFIRAGDFRHRPVSIQLNYSRAFGGKDLKMFGLSCVPDVRVVDLNNWTKSNSHANVLPNRSTFINHVQEKRTQSKNNPNATVEQQQQQQSKKISSQVVPGNCFLANTEYSSFPGEHLRVLVMGSDGVFDVVPLHDIILMAFQQYTRIATNNNGAGEKMQRYPDGKPKIETIHSWPDFVCTDHPFLLKHSPSHVIVGEALLQHLHKRSTDNITCIAVFL